MSSHANIRPEQPEPRGTAVFEQEWFTRIEGKDAMIAALTAEIVERAWVPAESGHWIHLCLEEVLVNAMLHGNEGDPNLRVKATLFDCEHEWMLWIEDEGTGFSASDLPDPDDPESIMLEHGRGLVLMNDWLDGLHYFCGGRLACLSRKKEPAS